MRVLAAIDAGPSAPSMLAVAGEISGLLDAVMDPVHVVEQDDETVGALAELPRLSQLSSTTGSALRLLHGETEATLLREAAGQDIAAVVCGTRGALHGRRPAGHVALALATGLDKLVVLVPPETPAAYRLHRVLVPLDGRSESSLAARELLLAAAGRHVEVDVVHVHHDEMPPFDDHSAYGAEAWRREFTARHCPPDISLGMHTRVGGKRTFLSWSGGRISDLPGPSSSGRRSSGRTCPLPWYRGGSRKNWPLQNAEGHRTRVPNRP